MDNEVIKSEIYSHATTHLIGNVPYEELYRIQDILKDMGVTFWLSCGMLLGLYRDGKYIQYDNDLDFDILTEKDINDEYDFLSPLKILTKSETKDYKRSYYSSGLETDLFFYRKKGNYIYSYFDDYNECGSRKVIQGHTVGYPIDFLNHIIDWDYNGHKIRCIEPELYIPWVYGDDWRTPQKKKATWDKFHALEGENQ